MALTGKLIRPAQIVGTDRGAIVGRDTFDPLQLAQVGPGKKKAFPGALSPTESHRRRVNAAMTGWVVYSNQISPRIKRRQRLSEGPWPSSCH